MGFITEDERVCDEIDAVVKAVVTDAFTTAWLDAPPFLRGERDLARYWFIRGRESANAESLRVLAGDK